MLPVYFDVKDRMTKALRDIQSLGMSVQECHLSHQEWANKRNRVIDISNMSEYESWLHERSLGLGGSDIGCLLGLDNYRTRYMLWLDKCMGQVDFKGNNFTKWGTLLESAVGNNFANIFGISIQQTPPTIVPEIMQWLRVNLDFDLPNTIFMGEVKTASAETERKWGEGITPELLKASKTTIFDTSFLDIHAVTDINDCPFPEGYFCQVQYAMMLAKKQYCFLTALIGGNDERHYVVKAVPDFQSLIRYEATYFMFHNVIRKNPPLMTEWELLDKFVKCDHSGEVESSDEITAKVVTLKEIKSKISEMVKIKADLEKDVKLFIGEKDNLVNGEKDVLAKWGGHDKTSIDKEMLEDLYPDIFEETKKVTAVRVLRLK